MDSVAAPLRRDLCAPVASPLQNPSGEEVFVAAARRSAERRERKAVFDQYGSEALRLEAPSGEGTGYREGYEWHGDAFRNFFGRDDPFANEFEVLAAVGPRMRAKQDPPIEQPLVVNVGGGVQRLHQEEDEGDEVGAARGRFHGGPPRKDVDDRGGRRLEGGDARDV